MFESNTKLTIIANWFIAAKKNNPIIKKLRIELSDIGQKIFLLKTNF